MFWSTSSYIQLAALYGIFSLFIRIELSTSGSFLFSEHTNAFYRAVTSHGLGMVFLFIMPGIISSLGNFSIPHSYAGNDFATPRLNNLAFWLSVFAIQLLIVAISYHDGVAAGWTLYFPLTGIDFSSSASIGLAVLFLHVLGLSSEFGAITFLVSLQVSRNMGISVLRYCLVSWAIAIVSFLLITTLPVLGAAITLLFSERIGNVANLLGNFIDGADPVAFQHLFWFFGHPEVYVIILPAFGIISERLRDISANRAYGHPGMTLAMWSIGLVGFFVWAHHMFTTGLADSSRIYFSAATAIIGIPTAIKIFAWALGLSEIRIRGNDFALVLSFIVCFTFGGFTGLILANSTVDLAYHDTYFVVGHFHFVLSIAAAIAAVCFFIAFVTSSFGLWVFHSLQILVVIGVLAVNILFGLQHVVGIEGHPRRVFLVPEALVGQQAFCNFAILPLLFVFSTVAISLRESRAVIRISQLKFPE